MSAPTEVIERWLAYVGGTAVVAAAAAVGARWICSVGPAVDEYMESLFDDVPEIPAFDG